MTAESGHTPPRERLTSFDRQTTLDARVQRVRDARALEALPRSMPRIARGAGVSYVAASFDRDAVSQALAGFDHFLGFDPTRGVLRVEAGVSIAEVQRFALPRGWYLRIAPGHARASIGGSIAVDAHGKNPARDGCFRAQLGALRIFHPDQGWIDAAVDSASWRAACGGFGLTGTIASAELKLARAPAAIALEPIAVASLAEAAEVLRQHADASLLYGWHNAQARRFGRGIVRIGRAVEGAAAHVIRRWRLPPAIHPFPLRLWHAPTLALANAGMRRRWLGVKHQSLARALLPLDGAAPYFAAFGPRGLIEAQWLWPHARFDAFAERLGALVARSGALIPLLSSKLFAGSATGAAFAGDGIALALHVVPDARGQRFLAAFDALALEFGGRPNPIKQSTLDAATLRAAIPQLDAWRAHIDAADPARLHMSELGRKLRA